MSPLATLIEAIERGDAHPIAFQRAFPGDLEARRLAESAYMDDWPAAKDFVRLKHPGKAWGTMTTNVSSGITAAVGGVALGFSDTKARALLLAALRALQDGGDDATEER